MRKKLKVLIAVPSGVMLHAKFAFSLMAMIGFTHNARPDVQVALTNQRGSLLPRQRREAVDIAKKIEASHLLFMDSDHVFPEDLLGKLLAWNKDCVGLNCPVKMLPSGPTARAKDPHDSKGIPVYTDREQEGLEEVWRVGTGVMLLSEKAFRSLSGGAFEMKYIPGRDIYQGEDWTMCAELEQNEIPIYIDHGLSWATSHIGTFDYTHEMVGEIAR